MYPNGSSEGPSQPLQDGRGKREDGTLNVCVCVCVMVKLIRVGVLHTNLSHALLSESIKKKKKLREKVTSNLRNRCQRLDGLGTV